MFSRPTITKFFAAATALLACASKSSPRVLHQSKSSYNERVIVTDDGKGIRRLFFEQNGATQSAIKIGAPLDLQLAYSRAAMLSLALVPTPKRVLIIGLGGGAMPMFLRTLFPSVEIDVVDIDPEVVSAARRFFEFKEDKSLRAHVGDGRAFVEKSSAKYDLIFLDAYGPNDIPRHLATLEFLKIVRSKLAPNGYAVGNVWESDANPLYSSMLNTYKEVFGHLCVIRVPNTSNRIFLSGPQVPEADKLTAKAEAFTKAYRIPFELAGFARFGCQADPESDARLLRD